MTVFRTITHVPIIGARILVRALTAGFDRLTGPVGRMSDRIEAHLFERTRLLRAFYADPSHRQAAPLPYLDAPLDLALRGGIRETA